MFGVRLGVVVGNTSISGGSPLLLDLYPSAAAAYSVRKLRTAYSGSAIRVRRTDLTEQNIGFDATGNLDTTALLSFVGTGALDNGFVTTWYDQSGNGLNQTQTTALNQPKIVSSGSVLLDNGKPSLVFDGSNDYFTADSSINLGTNDNYVAGVVNKGNTDVQVWFDEFLIQRFALYYATNSYILISNSTVGGVTGNINQQYLISASRVGTLSTIYRNGSTSASNNTADINTNKTLNIGANFLYGQCWFGKMQEIIIYNTDKSSTQSAINTNINSYYGIY
jgi:hypothetical protein